MHQHINNFLLAIAAMLMGCNTGKNSGTEDQTTVDSSNKSVIQKPLADTALNGCYRWIQQRDTAILQLQVKGANITGTLLYDFFEKDRNDGTLQAEMHDDVLIGWYLFKSEGILSVRQVAWKQVDRALVPATGEMIQSNDSLLFKDPAKLQFDTKSSFVKVPCIL